jgi:hypothetical protein
MATTTHTKSDGSLPQSCAAMLPSPTLSPQASLSDWTARRFHPVYTKRFQRFLVKAKAHFDTHMGCIERALTVQLAQHANKQQGKNLTRQLRVALAHGNRPEFDQTPALLQYTLDFVRKRTWNIYRLLLEDTHYVCRWFTATFFTTGLNLNDKVNNTNTNTNNAHSNSNSNSNASTSTDDSTTGTVATCSIDNEQTVPIVACGSCQADEHHEQPPTIGTVLNVASIGGGPGFDAVALALLASLLQTHNLTINATVLDVSLHWQSSLDAVAKQCQSQFGEQAQQQQQSAIAAIDMKLAFADITIPLEAPGNQAMAKAVAEADLIVFSFVLHENAVSIRSSSNTPTPDTDATTNHHAHSTTTTTTTPVVADASGCAPHSPPTPPPERQCIESIFASAKPSSVIIIVDGSHRLFPHLVALATQYQFACWLPIIPRGPRAALVMRKQPVPAEPLATVAESNGEPRDTFDAKLCYMHAHQQWNDRKTRGAL